MPQSPFLARLEEFLERRSRAASGASTAVFDPGGARPTGEDIRSMLAAIGRTKTDKGGEEALAIAAAIRLAMPGIRPLATMTARLMVGQGQIDAAASLCASYDPGENDAEWVAISGAVAFNRGSLDEARRLAARFADLAPAVAPKGGARSLPEIAVLNLAPGMLKEAKHPKNIHFSGNFVSQISARFADRFRFVSLFVNSANTTGALWNLRPDLVINNLATGDVLDDPIIRRQTDKCVRKLGRYCINPPDAVVETTRDRNYQRLKNIDGLLAPRTQYLTYDSVDDALVERLETQFEYPFIVRAPFLQLGRAMHLVGNRAELRQKLGELAPGCFAIQFVDSRGGRELFRYMRGVFVGEEFHLTRVDHLQDWKIHSFHLRDSAHGAEYYRNHPQLQEEERRFCADPEGSLGPLAWSALQSVRKHIRLDLFGIDFNLLDDGRILFFEANASMAFFGNRPWRLVRHPQEAEDRMRDSLLRYLEARIVGSAGSAIP